jgi:hypothetical protein
MKYAQRKRISRYVDYDVNNACANTADRLIRAYIIRR